MEGISDGQGGVRIQKGEAFVGHAGAWMWEGKAFVGHAGAWIEKGGTSDGQGGTKRDRIGLGVAFDTHFKC